MNTIVIAANNREDTSWILQLPDSRHWNVWKSDYYQPAGREAYAYLEYLISLPLNSSSDIVFCQGYPFSHDPEFLVHLANPEICYYGEVHECSRNGMPAVDWCPLDDWCRVLGLPAQNIYKFVAGAQYRLNAEQLHSRGKSFYRALFYLTMIPDNKAAWVLERLWPLIFGIEL